jgi:hypothetical protein
MRRSESISFGLGLLGLLVAGCGGGSSAADSSAGAALPVKKDPLVLPAEAGVAVKQSADPKKFATLIASRSASFGPGRANPFALTQEEKDYELQQASERLLTSAGGFSLQYQPPAETDTVLPQVEPQPYRRLAGIVVGDSVLAIIDLGDGRTEIIRPGMKIPNTEWTVVSIDEDKAVLRRGGKILPKEIIVRLESPPPGTAVGGNGGVPGVGGGGGFGPGGPRGGGGGGFGAPGGGAGGSD